MKDLYSENYETPMKETEDDTNKWNDIPSSLTGRIYIVKMSILTNLQIQYNPHQNATIILHRTRTNSPKICMEPP